MPYLLHYHPDTSFLSITTTLLAGAALVDTIQVKLLESVSSPLTRPIRKATSGLLGMVPENRPACVISALHGEYVPRAQEQPQESGEASKDKHMSVALQVGLFPMKVHLYFSLESLCTG